MGANGASLWGYVPGDAVAVPRELTEGGPTGYTALVYYLGGFRVVSIFILVPCGLDALSCSDNEYLPVSIAVAPTP